MHNNELIEQKSAFVVSKRQYPQRENGRQTNVFKFKELFKCVFLTTVQGNRVVFSIFYSDFIDKQFMAFIKSQYFCLGCLQIIFRFLPHEAKDTTFSMFIDIILFPHFII